MALIKIILVDDHKMFREGLSFLLSKSKKVKIVAEAENGKQFLDLLDIHKPDVVLMDINMPKMNGVEATEKAIAKYPDLKIIALSMDGDETYYYKMIHAGAVGFVLKKAGGEELDKAIKTVIDGQDFFSPELMKNIIINMGSTKRIDSETKVTYIKLTNREQETLEYICKGFSIKEVADKLYISPRTVEGHKSKIMEKLGAKNTSNLIIQAIKNKLIEI